MKKLINKNLLNMLMFLLLTLLLLSNCCEEITEPKPTEPDTTTQDFEFEEYLFGDGFSSSYVNGAWIFNENNIWAVGWFHGLTNIIRWNGTNWYEVNEFQGTSSGIYDICGVDSNLIYFAMGGIEYYKNKVFYRADLTHLPWNSGQSITDVWASSENNVWGVGEWGIIVHYDGVSWKKVSVDSTIHFNGIDGNPLTGKAYVIGRDVGYNPVLLKIFELNNDSAELIFNNDTSGRYDGSNVITYIGDNKILIGSNKVWELDILTRTPRDYFILPLSMTVKDISYVASKDFYFYCVENYGPTIIYHYNGNRYAKYNINESDVLWEKSSHAIKDLAVFTGWKGRKGYILTMKRRK